MIWSGGHQNKMDLTILNRDHHGSCALFVLYERKVNWFQRVLIISYLLLQVKASSGSLIRAKDSANIFDRNLSYSILVGCEATWDLHE